MKEILKESGADLDHGMDECCSIAESMIEEIHQIAIPDRSSISLAREGIRGSLKKRLLRQIRLEGRSLRWDNAP